MMRSSGTDSIDWVLVVNNDVAFYPGVLKHLTRGVSRLLSHSGKSIHHHSINIPDKIPPGRTTFGVGFTSLCCGGEWSAVIFSRKLVQAIGYFDENFYPAYYEDDDYAIRIHLSNRFYAAKLENTPLLHGEIDGSKDYLSGLFSQLYLHPEKSPAVDAWRHSHELGMKVSVPYIEQKWGIKVGDFKSKTKLDCKSIDGLNNHCRVGFLTPFNDSTSNLSTWILAPATAERINNSKLH
eukprot:CAMPEP_0170085274 /NCGR_PEP_ID=MMETSP0019_2-20121128/20198_1 /TAXON_ID=98059 /ORGANISM="Dinobryon sp., Strain UTEXLB2267" /LENGTH=236 /DNA_ID=CAMNT_0010301653 /DNA_START=401 /DNA_END=1111 /DNA_ORIENTATION=-